METSRQLRILKNYLTNKLGARIIYAKQLLFDRDVETSRGYGLKRVAIRQDLKNTKNEIYPLILALEELREPLPLSVQINGIHLRLWQVIRALQQNKKSPIVISYASLLNMLQARTPKEKEYSYKLARAITIRLKDKGYIITDKIIKDPKTGRILSLEVKAGERIDTLNTADYKTYRESLKRDILKRQ